MTISMTVGQMNTQQCVVDGKRVYLTKHEHAILAMLMIRGPNITSTKEDIYEALYPLDEHPDGGPEIKIIDVYISKLRSKVGFDHITTVWGQGYKIHQASIEQLTPVPVASIMPTVETTTQQETTHGEDQGGVQDHAHSGEGDEEHLCLQECCGQRTDPEPLHREVGVRGRGAEVNHGRSHGGVVMAKSKKVELPKARVAGNVPMVMTITREQLELLLEEFLEDREVPTNATFTVRVPTGGDYSGEDIDLKEIEIHWTVQQGEA